MVKIPFFGNLRKQKNTEQYEDDAKTIAPELSGVKTVKMTEVYESCPLCIGSVHDIGKRDMQQDSFGISSCDDEDTVLDKGVLAIVADGMGGLADGDRMSQIVVVNMLQGFEEADSSNPPSSILMGLVDKATTEVNNDLGEEKIGKCGSTVVAAIIKDKLLYYISVGDSHIYVWRDGQLIKVNKDHNYAAQLDEMVAKNELSPEEALNDPKRAALTSYIGMGNLEMLDQNINPTKLEAGDRILLMSDGVFGTLGDGKICELMGHPLKQSLILIDSEIRKINRSNQDNYTCIIIEIME
jgi:serine/threonine protein phosphatase PrpC